jgi:phosphoribosylamine--glycine ligase
MAESLNVSLIHCGAREAIIGDRLAGSQNYKVRLNVFGKFVNPLLYELSRRSKGSYHVMDTAEKGSVAAMAKECRNSDLVFIGNEAPTVNGLADELRKAKVAVIGPNKDFALEGDKHKTRLLLEEVYPKVNPRFYYIDPGKRGWEAEAGSAIKDMNGKVALKPIEPKYGKGVIVEGDHFPAERAYNKAIDIAKSGPFLIEEKVTGQEWSGQYLCDSKLHIQPFFASRDFKRALENDEGENTGGMATISDNNRLLPFMNEDEFEEGEKIVRKIVEALSKWNVYEEGFLTGVKYPAFVLTGRGNKMFEHNDRFGDPEGINALYVLKNDLAEVCMGMVEGNAPRLEFEKKAVAMIYAVPLTYGGFMKGYSGSRTISVDEKALSPKTRIYPASVELANGAIQISSSRSMAVVSKAGTLEEAMGIANEDVKSIDGPVRHRTDISMEYVQRCIDNMKELRKKKW